MECGRYGATPKALSIGVEFHEGDDFNSESGSVTPELRVHLCVGDVSDIECASEPELGRFLSCPFAVPVMTVELRGQALDGVTLEAEAMIFSMARSLSMGVSRSLGDLQSERLASLEGSRLIHNLSGTAVFPVDADFLACFITMPSC